MINSLVSAEQLRTPVLFLVFNRPDTTQRVFEAIRNAKPPRLYIAADGPRTDRPGEAQMVAQVREIVTAVDWRCEVKTLFRKKNLGCKHAVSGAITWFFEHEEQGIILEDDCLPNNSFFQFCEILLEKYKYDQRIGQISGFNGLGKYQRDGCSYHFSNFGSIWGWATWKRAWNSYDVDMKGYPYIKESSYIPNIINDKKDLRNRIKAFDQTYAGLIDTWDYQWIYCRLVNRYLIILPSKNLIKNIGFGANATHTTVPNSKLSSLSSYEINFPLIPPSHFCPDFNFEKLLRKSKQLPLVSRIYNKLMSIF